jgi:hypothetical protein
MNNGDSDSDPDEFYQEFVPPQRRKAKCLQNLGMDRTILKIVTNSQNNVDYNLFLKDDNKAKQAPSIKASSL